MDSRFYNRREIRGIRKEHKENFNVEKLTENFNQGEL